MSLLFRIKIDKDSKKLRESRPNDVGNEKLLKKTGFMSPIIGIGMLIVVCSVFACVRIRRSKARPGHPKSLAWYAFCLMQPSMIRIPQSSFSPGLSWEILQRAVDRKWKKEHLQYDPYGKVFSSSSSQ